jgi:hypothetical protein
LADATATHRHLLTYKPRRTAAAAIVSAVLAMTSERSSRRSRRHITTNRAINGAQSMSQQHRQPRCGSSDGDDNASSLAHRLWQQRNTNAAVAAAGISPPIAPSTARNPYRSSNVNPVAAAVMVRTMHPCLSRASTALVTAGLHVRRRHYQQQQYQSSSGSGA